MKISVKQVIQLIIIFSLAFPLIPSITKYASAKDQTQSDIPVSFDITASDRGGLELVLSAPSYHITEIQVQDQLLHHVNVPGAVTTSIPGEPQLPVANKLIAVPPQAVVTLEIVGDSNQQLSGNYQLATSPFPARLDESNPTQRWDNTQEVRFQQFETSQKPLQYPVRIAEEAWLRDQRVVRLEYSPFVYNTNTDKLIWYPSVTLKIHFDFPFGQPKSSQFLQQPEGSDSPFDTALSTTLLNFDKTPNWESTNLPTEALVAPPEVGARYRIAIDQDGIFKLTYSDLVAANPAIADMDPRRLHMTNQGEDVIIYISGQEDGSFDPGDYIIFFGQRFYGERLAALYQSENQHWQVFARQNTDGSYYSWKPEFNEIMLEKYTHENIYWLFEGATDGLRMNTENGDPSQNSNTPVESYRETIRAEESFEWKTTLFAGEESWFWKRLYRAADGHFNTPIPFNTELSAPAPTGPDAIVRAEFVSAVGNSNETEDHHTKLYFNSNIIGESDGFKWSGKSRYSFDGAFPATIVNDGANAFAIEALTDAEFANPDYFIDWFEIEYNRYFVAVDDAIIFTSPETGLQKYQVGGFSDTAGMIVLDITDPLKPVFVNVTNSLNVPGQVTISLDHNDLSIAMDAGGKSISSSQISYYQPPNWAAMTAGADYVFITHVDLLNTTQILADYRTGTGLSTVVIDVNDLYNEFNFGIYHPIAIKNFLSYAFENWEIIPTYTLLVGDGHWNFHKYNLEKYGAGPQLIPPHLVWVDPWQGEVDSANLLATIVGTDPFPDMMIARLPVNNPTELNAYINKVIEYESTPYENWQQNHIFVADNPDYAGDFTTYAENIVEQYIDPATFANEIRIYQEEYGCTNIQHPEQPTSTLEECVAVRNAITDTVNNTGALILNFIGHASPNRWSHEHISTLFEKEIPHSTNPLSLSATIENWTNLNQYPIILSMTCLDGYWSGPLISPGTSMIEELVRKEASGAIGAFSPTGLGVSTGHDLLHKGFYDALMNDGILELGSAAQNGKLWLYQTGMNQDLLHTFTVFGDPALQIRYKIQNKIFLPLTDK